MHCDLITLTSNRSLHYCTCDLKPFRGDLTGKFNAVSAAGCLNKGLRLFQNEEYISNFGLVFSVLCHVWLGDGPEFLSFISVL